MKKISSSLHHYVFSIFNLFKIQTNQLVSTIKELSVEEFGLKRISQQLHSGIRSGQYIIRFVSNEFVLNNNIFINR